MKRVIACAITLGMAFALFFYVPCITVSAATGTPAVHKSATGSSQGVTWEINLDQYYPEQYAESGNASGQVNTMVYYRITNVNDDAAYVRNTGFTINWVTAPYITDYQTFSDDLYIGYQNTSGSWYIYADSPYSYSSGVVVPPHSSLYCIGVITTSASVNGNAISSQAISSVTLTSHTVTLGDYPYGSIGQQIEEIENIIDDIRTQLIFTGTLNEYSPSSYSTLTFNYDSPAPNTSMSYGISRLSSFQIMDDTVITGSNTVYQTGSVVIPFQVMFRINNYNSYNLNHAAYFVYAPVILPAINGISYVIYDFRSNLFDTYQMQYITVNGSRYLNIRFFYKYNDNDGGYIPVGIGSTSFTLLAIKDDDVSDPVISNPPVSINQYSFTQSNKNYVYNSDQLIYGTLQDIYGSLNNGSYSDTTQDAQDLQNQEDAIHQQEAQWYSDNQTAIEATGLGNYQYNNGFISTFGIARQQISMLWTALGDWTYVYYLVFLFGLATYILRHEPTMKAKQARAAAAQAQKERTEYYRSHKK